MSEASTAARTESFLRRYSPQIQAQLRAARVRLRGRFPRGYELIFDNYNALVFAISPTQKSAEAFISIAGYPRWVTLFFLHGAQLRDPQGLLVGTGRTVRGIRLRSAEEIDSPAVVDLIEQAMQRARTQLEAAPPLTSVIKSESAKRRARQPAAKRKKKTG